MNYVDKSIIKIKQNYSSWIPSRRIMKSIGLGDDIEKFTKATGIKKVVDTMSKGLNIPCGCAARKGALNKMFPYKN